MSLVLVVLTQETLVRWQLHRCGPPPDQQAGRPASPWLALISSGRARENYSALGEAGAAYAPSVRGSL